VAAIGAEEFDIFVPELVPVAIKLALALRTGHPKYFRHGSSSYKISEIRISKAAPRTETNRTRINSKSEYRNPKQPGPNEFKIRKIQNTESDPSRLEHCSCFVFHHFEFVSDFGFRASSFLFQTLAPFAPLREI